jgi:thioredoxin-like negative regulator of GroEL
VQQEVPVLGEMPEKKRTKKILLLAFILLLLGSSLGLSYLIFNQQRDASEAQHAVVKNAQLTKPQTQESNLDSRVEPDKKMAIKVPPVKLVIYHEPELVKPEELVVDIQESPDLDINKIQKPMVIEPIAKAEQASIPIVVEPIAKVEQKSTPIVVKQSTLVVEKSPVETPKLPSIYPEKTAVVPPDNKNTSVLEIKTVQLTKAQLAQIKLKKAQTAEDQGALNLAAETRQQALTLEPTLNEVRKSLALYYYGQGSIDKATELLQTGAVVSPDYSDFNLMLSRIALKTGDFQKAYLYLEQHPPEVAGHLDYYVSHAILAQKFRKYEQSERLYLSLLAERPNNGRWRMALAIAQDRQGKVSLALSSYKSALLQPDLSSKAKAYVNQRLIYLEKTL